MPSTEIIVAVSAVTIGVVGYFAWKYELLSSVKIVEETVGPFLCVYTNYVGPYHGVSKPMMDVSKVVNESLSLDKKTGGALNSFGVYYDKPGEVPPEDCRASVGVIVKQGETVEALKAAAGELEKNDKLKERNLKIAVFPASRFLFCKLPFYSFASIIIGIMRAYSALNLAMAAVCDDKDVKVYGSLEIYNRPEHWMKIGFPLNNRDILLPFNIKDE